MFRKILLGSGTGLLVLLLVAFLWAQGCHSGSQPQNSTGVSAPLSSISTSTVNMPVEVGNKICPVVGEKIVDKTKVTLEYKGKIYNFCCADCVAKFKKDPEKYIRLIKKEKTAPTVHPGMHHH